MLIPCCCAKGRSPHLASLSNLHRFLDGKTPKKRCEHCDGDGYVEVDDDIMVTDPDDPWSVVCIDELRDPLSSMIIQEALDAMEARYGDEEK